MWRATCGVLALRQSRGRDGVQLERTRARGSGEYAGASLSSYRPASGPSVSPSAVISSCTDTINSAPPRHVIVIQDFRFKPRCFYGHSRWLQLRSRTRTTSHRTFSIDCMLVNALLRPHKTYKHWAPAGFCTWYHPFHCSLHSLQQDHGVMTCHLKTRRLELLADHQAEPASGARVRASRGHPSTYLFFSNTKTKHVCG